MVQPVQARSQDFLKGGYMDVWLYVRMHKNARLGGGWWHAPPEKCLEIRRSEIASEAILGQKQSGSS